MNKLDELIEKMCPDGVEYIELSSIAKIETGKLNAYQRTYVLTEFSNKVSVRYLYHFLKHNLMNYLEGRTNKSAVTYIVLSTLKNFEIALPPIEVQEEIVKILDTFTELTAELTVELTAELTARKSSMNIIEMSY